MIDRKGFIIDRIQIRQEKLYKYVHVYITLFSARAFMTLPRAKRDLLIFAPSLNLEPLFLVTVALSDPARSTRHNLAILTSVDKFAVLSFCLMNT